MRFDFGGDTLAGEAGQEASLALALEALAALSHHFCPAELEHAWREQILLERPGAALERAVGGLLPGLERLVVERGPYVDILRPGALCRRLDLEIEPVVPVPEQVAEKSGVAIRGAGGGDRDGRLPVDVGHGGGLPPPIVPVVLDDAVGVDSEVFESQADFLVLTVPLRTFGCG